METALAHAIGALMLLGYGMEYYFHLRKCLASLTTVESSVANQRRFGDSVGHHKNHPH